MRRFLSMAAGLAILATAVPALALAQQPREVTGKVTQAEGGLPITEATITLLGNPLGVRTNERGEYRLRVPSGDISLLVRAIGFRRATARVAAGQSTADFVLEKDVLQLEGVTVTGQATTVDKQNASTAIASVSAKEIVNVPAGSIEGNLAGKVTGARIFQNGGAPGGGAQVQVRGSTSILGQTDPLFVVDGVIVSDAAISSGGSSITRASGQTGSGQDATVNRIADLNPNDVESVEVLKSAAASAMYGSRATNGVVVITTKKGKSGETRYEFTQRVGSQNMAKNLSSRHFTDYASVHPFTGGPIGDAVAQTVCNPACPWYDYQKQLYGKHDPGWESVLSASGGFNNTRFFASLNDKQESGIMMNTGTRRTSGRLNLDQTVGSKLTVSGGLGFTHNFLQRGISNNDNAGVSPMWVLGYVPAIVDLGTPDATGHYPRVAMNGGGTATSNPFENITHVVANEEVWHQTASVRLNYSLFSSAKHSVNLTYLGGLDRFQQEGYLYSPNYLQFESADGFLGTANQIDASSFQMNQSMNAVWTWTTGKKFVSSVQTSAGVTREQSSLNGYTINDNGLLPGVGTVQTGTSFHLVNGYQIFRDESVYLNETVMMLDEKLSINAGVRADRSSADGDRKKFYSYPKYSASYRFVKPAARWVGFIDEVKVRAAIGQSGNRPRFGDRDVVLAGGGIIGGNLSVVQPSSTANPRIKPEVMNETEFGLDAVLLHERASLEITSYARVIKDLLLVSPLAPTSGISSKTINGGRMSVHGVELGFTIVPIRTRNAEWTFKTTYGSNTQYADYLPVAPFNSNGFGVSWGHGHIAPGQKSSLIWGNTPFSCLNTTNAAGQLVVGTGSDGKPCHALPISTSLAGSVVRDTILGDWNMRGNTQFMNQFSYKKWSATVLVDWRNGGYMSNMTNTAFDQGGNSRDYTDPSAVAGMQLGLWRYQAWATGDARPYIQDGTYVKLREVSVNFEAPKRWADLARARSMRLGLSGRNLAMLSNYWGHDSEFNNGGNTAVGRFVDLAPYPSSRQFFLSVDLGY